MPRTVTAGLEDSPESRSAVEWAAGEAMLRGLPLKLVYVSEPASRFVARTPLLDPGTYRRWAEQLTREAADGTRLRHPGIEVIAEQVSGSVADVLCEAAGAAELLVLGSRRLGTVEGFMVGSVSLAVVARAEAPVVLVRAQEQAADGPRTNPATMPSAGTSPRPVVLGLDVDHPDDAPLEFAFDAAARRRVALRAVHAWPEPPTSFYRFSGDAELRDSLERGRAALLTEVLHPWRQRFPDVEVVEVSRSGSAAQVLVDDARDASLVVVGRRVRSRLLGAHIGHVAHSALHHVAAPVAVVPHG